MTLHEKHLHAALAIIERQLHGGLQHAESLPRGKLPALLS
jgi:hypothetical protein